MSFVQHVTAGKSVYGKRLPEKGLKGRASAGQPEDMGMNKRHRTRQALHKRQLTADTLLYLTPPEGLSEDEDEDSGDEEEEEQGDSGHPLPTPGAAIEIPVVRTLTDEELATRMAPPPPILSEQQPAADEEEEDISDAHYRRLHLVFELKEQALREQSVRTGGARRLVQRSGRQVSSTELLLAPSVERKLTREDHKMVLGKTVCPKCPMIDWWKLRKSSKKWRRRTSEMDIMRVTICTRDGSLRRSL